MTYIGMVSIKYANDSSTTDRLGPDVNRYPSMLSNDHLPDRLTGLWMRLVRKATILSCFLTAALILPSAGCAENSEYLFKAAFLVNFARLVEWPSTAFKSPDDPLVICVLDPAPFGDALQALDGKVVMGRRLAIRSFEQVLRSQICHIFFANTVDLHRRRSTIQALSGKPVLVVGEEEGFARNEGMIGVFSVKNKISFEINPERTEMAGLRVSSRLLKLGRIVTAGGRE